MPLFGRNKSSSSEHRVYLDYAAATPLDPRVLEKMFPYFSERFGNPSSLHAEGRAARTALEEARERVAHVLNARSEEVVFTSGGTESNNLAIQGTVRAYKESGARAAPHILTSAIEHPSVLEPIRLCEKYGARPGYLVPDSEGCVNPTDVRNRIVEATCLVSLSYVNGEVGSVQHIAEAGRHIRRHRSKNESRYPYFHVDASQAPLFFRLDVEKLRVDLLSLDAHKFYGPKGIGILYVRRKTRLAPLLVGGGQENELRSGTENLPLIVGFAEALSIADRERETKSKHVSELRDCFVAEIEQHVPGAVLNGSRVLRAPNNVNVSIPGLESEFMVLWLDEQGIACGARSACADAKGDDKGSSYVVRALNQSEERARSSLRFTLGRETTKDDIDKAVRALKEMVQRLTH